MFIFAGMTAIGEGFLVALLVPWLTDILHGDELAWAALLIVTGIFLRAIDPLPPGARGFER